MTLSAGSYTISYMNQRQEHYGRSFYQDKKTGYWISTDYPRIRAHRWVWISVNGSIPKTCHIHHKDENKSNNSIENLQIVTFSQHAKIHMNEERSNVSRKWMDEIRPLTKEWHTSEEGKAWHKYHALKNNFGTGKLQKYKCEVCLTEYETVKMGKSRFCSNPCKSKFRRDSGLDDVNRSCKGCNEPFICNKYAKTAYCSRSCSSKRMEEE